MKNTFSIKALLSLTLAVGVTSACMAANSGADTVREILKKEIPQAAVQQVNPSEAQGIYEVLTKGKELVYVTGDGKYLFTGDMVELSSKRNISQERRDSLSQIDFSALPLEKAIKIVQGAGTYKLAVFSDPDCPYCQRFEKELEKLTDATIYIFTFPLSIHPNAEEKTKRAWCSKDQGKAWRNMVLKGVMPEAKPDCANPVSDVIALAEKLGVNGTPTIFMANGMKLSSGTPAAVIQQRISDIGK